MREQTDSRIDVLQISHCIIKRSLLYTHCGPGERRRYSDSLWVGRSGNRISVGAKFSASAQTGPAAKAASYKMSTGSFSGVEPHLAPKLKKEYSYPSTPRMGLRGLF